jgi:hypothetical protein
MVNFMVLSDIMVDLNDYVMNVVLIPIFRVRLVSITIVFLVKFNVMY